MRLRINIVTPAPRGSSTGNRVTAARWSRILRELGHRVIVSEALVGGSCDLLIALHSRKSAPSIRRFKQNNPDAPIVVALTGTDIYHDMTWSAEARNSIDIATKLLLLQSDALTLLSREQQEKAFVIIQSETGPSRPSKPLKNLFEVVVSGHLRPVKDPFRAAMASRKLPQRSRIQITHMGAALSSNARKRAEREMQINPRYRWLGEQPHWKARQILARSKLMVLSSKIEGGANVISESLAAGIPILATRISGNIGLLGKDYSGYFDVGNTVRLAELLQLSESSSRFYRQLKTECKALAPLVRPAEELARWRELLRQLAF